jgi:hypothetical protein
MLGFQRRRRERDREVEERVARKIRGDTSLGDSDDDDDGMAGPKPEELKNFIFGFLVVSSREFFVLVLSSAFCSAPGW